MDHESVLEALEIAAVEPGGLDRLMAGDTPTAMAVAGHLVGCASCTLELDRLRKVSELTRGVVADSPSPDLRDRTLAYVRAHGVPRGPGVTAPAAATTPALAVVPAVAESPAGTRRATAFRWVAAVAAAVVLSVAATSLIVGSRVDDRLSAQDQAIEDLATVTTATLRLTAEPDAARVSLDNPSGDATTGTLVYSPASSELVVVATGLNPPPDGQEYRCWVIVDGARKGIGKMFFGGGLAYWVGPSPAVAGLAGGETFGVSLVGPDGAIVGSDPVLTSAS